MNNAKLGSLLGVATLTILLSTVHGAAQMDRDALIALYNSTDGDNWTDNSAWKEAPSLADGFNDDPCSEPIWFGVRCDAGGVATLTLTENGLVGFVPAELGDLANLGDLRLGSNQLTGAIPVELGNLAFLRILILDSNQLTGAIPAELGDLANLQFLVLDSNQLTGAIPPELANLVNLQSLRLSSNQLTGEIPVELGSLVSLRTLNLHLNQLTGGIPSQLGNLTNLGDFRVESNQLTGAIPAELGDLANLEDLNLSNNQLTGEIPSELGNLTDLQSLRLSSNQLSGEIPADLGNLANLQFLWLHLNQLTGEIPLELGNLTNLLSLLLHLNQLRGAIPAELGNLAVLQFLNLVSNQLTGEIPMELGSLTNLGTLDLGDNQLTGEIPVELGNLAHLRQLWLFGNELTGAIPADLGNLAKLEDLRLGGNQLTGTIPAELGDLTLLVLNLVSNQLTGEIPAELGNLGDLKFFLLRNNQLTGEIPAELARLTSLQEGNGLDVRFNHLYTDSNTLRTFLNSKSSNSGDWEDTQTLPLYYAQFADGEGALGSQIVLFNLNDESAATGQMQILGEVGTGLTVDLNGETVAGMRDVSLPAAGLLTLGTDSLGELQTGSVRITTDRHVEGVVIFGGEVGLAGVGSSPDFPTGFAAPMLTNEDDQINTGVAVTSLSDEDGPLDLTLLDASGMTLATASDMLMAHGHRALFVTEIGWDTAIDFADFAGTLVGTCAEAMTATVLQTRPGEFVTMPVAPFQAPQAQAVATVPQGAATPEPRLYFAQFADGLGALASQILLLNLSPEETATAQITLRNGMGEPLTVDLNGQEVVGETQVQIAASGLRVLATDGVGDLVTGSVSVTSDQPLAGVIVFAGEGVGAAGVGGSVELPEGFLAPMETNRAAAIRTGVAMMNLETEELALTADLMASEGSLLDSVQLTLAALGYLAIFLDEFDWKDSVDLSLFEGLLRVRSNGRMAATVIQTRPGQFATMPVAAKPLD